MLSVKFANTKWVILNIYPIICFLSEIGTVGKKHSCQVNSRVQCPKKWLYIQSEFLPCALLYKQIDYALFSVQICRLSLGIILCRHDCTSVLQQ